MEEKKIYRITWACEDMSDRLLMTEEGFRLINWLIDHRYLPDEMQIEEEDDSKIHRI